MREIATIFGGIGLLIFAYLLLNNQTGAKNIIGAASSALTSTISVLQGNSGGMGIAPPGGSSLPPVALPMGVRRAA